MYYVKYFIIVWISVIISKLKSLMKNLLFDLEHWFDEHGLWNCIVAAIFLLFIPVTNQHKFKFYSFIVIWYRIMQLIYNEYKVVNCIRKHALASFSKSINILMHAFLCYNITYEMCNLRKKLYKCYYVYIFHYSNNVSIAMWHT